MKINIKDKNAVNMQQSMHPLDYFSLAGQYANPAFFAREFNGTPVSYYPGTAGANAVSSKPPSLLGGGGSSQQPSQSSPPQWSFPQYSQTWAFTPPGPQPYGTPPAFDPKSPTGTALPKPTAAPKPAGNSAMDIRSRLPVSNSRTALSPFSLDALKAKYMR